MKICLWDFPETDFPAYCELVGPPHVGSYAEYLTLLSAVQADQEREGHEVVQVTIAVARMREKLSEEDLPNSPDGRAAIVAMEGANR